MLYYDKHTQYIGVQKCLTSRKHLKIKTWKLFDSDPFIKLAVLAQSLNADESTSTQILKSIGQIQKQNVLLAFIRSNWQIAYSLYLLNQLILLKHARIKLVEPDYKRFPILINIKLEWEFRKIRHLIAKLGSFKMTLHHVVQIHYAE